jgi:hypothetical protein
MATLQSQLAKGTAIASPCPLSAIKDRTRVSQGALSQAWFTGNSTEQWHSSAYNLFAGSDSHHKISFPLLLESRRGCPLHSSHA